MIVKKMSNIYIFMSTKPRKRVADISKKTWSQRHLGNIRCKLFLGIVHDWHGILYQFYEKYELLFHSLSQQCISNGIFILFLSVTTTEKMTLHSMVTTKEK